MMNVCPPLKNVMLVFVRLVKMKLDEACPILEIKLWLMSLGLLHDKCNIHFPELLHTRVCCLPFVYALVVGLNLNSNMKAFGESGLHS